MQIFGYTIPFTGVSDISKPQPEEANVRRHIQKPQQQVYRLKQKNHQTGGATSKSKGA